MISHYAVLQLQDFVTVMNIVMHMHNHLTCIDIHALSDLDVVNHLCLFAVKDHLASQMTTDNFVTLKRGKNLSSIQTNAILFLFEIMFQHGKQEQLAEKL